MTHLEPREQRCSESKAAGSKPYVHSRSFELLAQFLSGPGTTL